MIDLHIHTTASDGSETPTSVIRTAKRLGLQAIAVTDHDSVEGVEEALRAGDEEGVTVVPAFEMSSEIDGRDAHFLGYFIDWRSESLKKRLADLRQSRLVRAERIIEHLNELGVKISMYNVLDEARGGAVGRAHVARALTNLEAVASIQEAFNLYLARGRPAYVQKAVYTPREVIEIINEVGGVASIAHPGVTQIDAWMDELVSYGLDAIEVYHSDHTREQIIHYMRMAEDRGLAISGGSDSHGARSSRGETMGKLRVPAKLLDSLRARIRDR